jgi:hypothetical protein
VTQDLNVRTFRTFEFFAMAAVILLPDRQGRSRWARGSSPGACSGIEGGMQMFHTALTLNDLLFLAKGAGMTLQSPRSRYFSGQFWGRSSALSARQLRPGAGDGAADLRAGCASIQFRC